MRDDEKNRLEERILAYFDGALEGPGAKQLLSEVASDSEKQALFDSHASLARLISSARIPLETPMAVNRSLAEKIPGLLMYLPHLLGGAETVALVSQVNPFLAFFSKFSLSTALYVGGTVAVLTTAGVVINNSVLDKPVSQSNALHRSYSSTSSAEASSTSPLASQPSVSVPLSSSNNSSSNTSSSNTSSSNTSSSNTSDRGLGSLRDVDPVISNSAAESRLVEPNQYSYIRKSTHQSLQSHSLMSVQEHYSEHSRKGVSNAPGSRMKANSIDYAFDKARVRSSDLLPAASASVIESTNATDEASRHDMRAAAANANASISDQSIGNVSPVLPAIAVVNANQTAPIHLSLSEIEPVREYTIKPFVANAVKFVFLPQVAPNPKSIRQNQSGLRIANTPSVGVNIGLSDNLGLRAQVGQSFYGQITPYTSTEYVSGYSLLERHIHESAVQFVSSLFTTAGFSLTLNPDSWLRFSVSGDGGLVWLSPAAVTAGIGASAEWDVYSRWSLRPAVSLENTWVREAPATNQDETGEIINRQLNAATINNVAVGISLSLILRY